MEKRESGEEEWVKEEKSEECGEKKEEETNKEEKEEKEKSEEKKSESEEKKKSEECGEKKEEIKEEETKESETIDEKIDEKKDSEENMERDIETKEDIDIKDETIEAAKNDAGEISKPTLVVEEDKEPTEPVHTPLPSSSVSSNKQARLQATHLVEVARHIFSHHCRHDSFASRRTLDCPSHFLLPHPVLRHRQRETPHVSAK